MSTLVGAAICLVLRFEWNGQVLQAGRRPIYGVDVPNVKRSSSEPPGTRESILYPLSPASFRHLADLTAAGQPIAVVLAPALPPAPGNLEVRLSIVACPGTAAALPPSAPGERPAEFKVSASLPVQEGPGAGTRMAVAASGTLSAVSPLELTLHFPREAEPEEELGLVVASAASPATRVVLSWSRFRHPGQERYVWTAPPPGPSTR
jgi:hypothetical protein